MRLEELRETGIFDRQGPRPGWYVGGPRTDGTARGANPALVLRVVAEHVQDPVRVAARDGVVIGDAESSREHLV